MSNRLTFPTPGNNNQSHVHHYIPASTAKGQSSGNAHPYAIRTTSTALLSRSNSVTQDHPRHHYVPPSPKLDHTSHEKDSSFGRATGSGHRYSRSLSNDLGPRPLPSPPMTSAPSFAPVPVEQGDLPANPKHWTPTQLSAYLITALRVRGDTELPAPIAHDISNFVIRAHINGKAFLRLQDHDLQDYHINPLWRTSLLSASHNLSQNVLKGRIWGFAGGEESSPESPANDLPQPRFFSPKGKDPKPRYSSAITTDPESLYESAESSSSLDLSGPRTERKDTTPRSRISGRYKNGRVKGMVKSWEVRTASESGSDIEDAGEDSSDLGTVKRILPAPPLPVPNFPPNDMDTITPNSSAASSPSRPLPARPLLMPTGTMRFSSAPPLTPPLHVSNPPEGDLTMEDLLKMNGIQPDRTRAGKRKAARAKAVHPQLSYDPLENGDEGAGPGVEAWLASDGVTVKKIGGGSGSSGRPSMMMASGLGDLFETAPVETESEAPQHTTSAADATDISAQQELDVLRNVLAETEELARHLAARLDDYEGRVVQMGVLQDEIALEKTKESSCDDGSGIHSSLSDTTLADEEGHDDDMHNTKKAFKMLKEENEELKKNIQTMLRTQDSEHSSSPPTAVDNPSLIAKAISLLRPSTSSPSATSKKRPNKINKAIEDHLRVSALPGYLVLIGIGVCVVCLKVLGRRFVGKGR